MAELQLCFLGPGRVIQARRGELQFRGRLLLALLAYLAVESGQAHSRESLLGLLWPEMTETDARNNLRVTWSRLRNILGTGHDIPFLIGTRFQLQFNPESNYWLDVAEFETLLAATTQHPHQERRTCPDCCQTGDLTPCLIYAPSTTSWAAWKQPRLVAVRRWAGSGASPT